MARLVALVVVFLAFTAYSVEVVVTQGFAALFESHVKLGWESQVFLDLVLAITAFNLLAWPDAKKRDIAYAPYLVATITLGSIGVLAYLIHREVRALRGRETALV